MHEFKLSSASRNKTEDRIPIAEWIVAAIGAVLVGGTFCFLGYRAVVEQGPPSFTAEIKQIEATGNNHAVTVIVHNQGGRPVSDLVVRATRDGQDERELTIDYIPSHSARRVTFLFDKSTAANQLECVFTSYNDP
ncbi:hypothetical protein SH528x_004038 [Novipirellula sp. SH528]|uniref:hypothetical protein n=1 Tax=Novipirellula sp. SH528 TaxID=3454466 RepID=UPI003FA13D36